MEKTLRPADLSQDNVAAASATIPVSDTFADPFDSSDSNLDSGDDELDEPRAATFEIDEDIDLQASFLVDMLANGASLPAADASATPEVQEQTAGNRDTDLDVNPDVWNW